MEVRKAGLKAMQYTEEQRKVIELHNRNLLVAAAAGSGKTAVLVERILHMIMDEEHPVDIDRLLVVTFTKAAASEMRERIGILLEKKLRETPENEHLQKQSALLHNAKITTIDSFCQSVLRNHFELADLDPAFRVADENEIRLIREDILEELLEEKFAAGGEEFLLFADAYQGRGRDGRLENSILELYAYASGFPWQEDYLALCAAGYEIETPKQLQDAPWMKELLGEIHESAAELVNYIEAALAVCRGPEGPLAYEKALLSDADALAALLHERTYDGLHNILHNWKKEALARVKSGSCDEEKKQRVMNIRKKVYAELDKLTRQEVVLSAEELCRLLAACRPAVRMLVGLTEEFTVRFREKKRELNIVDFSDLEHETLHLFLEKKEDGTLMPTPTALAYREEFAEILIDEYQDSNLVQELLLGSISKEEEGHPNRFMVGDVKQSIYRFRLARPEIFLEKYEQYGMEDGDYQRIDLHRNFRSRREVLACVNEICGRLMRGEIGHIVYDEAAALYVGAQFPDGGDVQVDGGKQRDGSTDYRAEILLSDVPAEWKREQRIEQEARMTALRIRELVGNTMVTERRVNAQGETEAYLRPASYRDIVILLRTSGDWFDIYRRVLEREGIPVYVATRTGYFAASEIQTIFHYLKILDNPRQDIPMYGVLLSVFGGFTEEEIVALRTGGDEDCLYESLKRAAGDARQDGNNVQSREESAYEGERDFAGRNGEAQLGRKKAEGGAEYAQSACREAGGADVSASALCEKAAAFLEQYVKLRDSMLFTPIHELLRMLIRDTGYDLLMEALPGGAKRRANLDALIEKAAAYEQTSFHGLFHFMRYIESLRKYEVDYGEADIADERADLVRIMTIHASKGLEFPICFVGGLDKQFNAQDEKKSVVLDAELGIGIDYVNPIARTKTRNLLKSVMNRKEKKERLGEELRVLYVALTRAKEKLVMTGTVKDAEAYGEELREQLSLYGIGTAPGVGTGMRTGQHTESEVLEEKELRERLSAHGTVTAPGIGIRNEQRTESGSVAGMTGITPLPVGVICGVSSMLDWVMAAIYAGNLQDSVVTLAVQDAEQLSVAELKADTAEELRKQLLSGGVDVKEAWEEQCGERFSFTYPYEALRGLYTKTTVSELKIAALEAADGERETADTIFPETHAKTYIPRFEREEVTLGTTRGTAYHKALELMDLSAENTLAALEADLRAREQTGALPKGYYELLNLNKLLQFKKSSLAARMLAAEQKGKLYREQPFVLGLPASRLNAAFPTSETVLIQGIIDVFFEEEDGLVIADYKTDRVQSAGELRERYQVQLDYYGEALARLTHKKVKQKLLYSFALGEEIELARQ
ncbi:MAG: UvrD-helicase domain-containing protein [bacterium]|nr:UvrD-helicase domain-containing protein [bacterium]